MLSKVKIINSSSLGSSKTYQRWLEVELSFFCILSFSAFLYFTYLNWLPLKEVHHENVKLIQQNIYRMSHWSSPVFYTCVRKKEIHLFNRKSMRKVSFIDLLVAKHLGMEFDCFANFVEFSWNRSNVLNWGEKTMKTKQSGYRNIEHLFKQVLKTFFLEISATSWNRNYKDRTE